MPAARAEPAPAKVNLTLRVIGRRADGYHDIESLVAFAAVGDTLTFTPGQSLELAVRGPTAVASGEVTDNLVLKAARGLAERVEGLKVGRFILSKRLPVAAGLGGGSADAAAALRLLARANAITLDDPRLMAAARATGADVPVCLDPRPRLMRGIGDILSDPLDLPRLPAVLVNPRVAVPTKDVFAALRVDLAKSTGARTPSPTEPGLARVPTQTAQVEQARLALGEGWGGGAACSEYAATPTPDPSPQGGGERERPSRGKENIPALLRNLSGNRNDLEAPAVALQPVIAEVLNDLRTLSGCHLARMSGSGATCFGLFASARAAAAAAQALRAKHPDWWVRATTLG
jgi:4-diphosphocytidyl-2-C-methyl-D-erythritol kinase